MTGKDITEKLSDVFKWRTGTRVEIADICEEAYDTIEDLRRQLDIHRLPPTIHVGLGDLVVGTLDNGSVLVMRADRRREIGDGVSHGGTEIRMDDPSILARFVIHDVRGVLVIFRHLLTAAEKLRPELNRVRFWELTSRILDRLFDELSKGNDNDTGA